MAYEFRLPDIGEGLTEAEVVEWLIEEGAPVALDQPLVQVETDKAVTDIPSPRAGVLLRRGAPAGSVVRVGEVLAVIGGGDEEEGSGEEESAPIVGTLPAPREKSQIETQNETSAVTSRSGPRTSLAGNAALPLVRKLAKDLGVDIDAVPGSGPGGRITKEDVEAAAASAPSAALSPGDERVHLSKLRRTIAERMARSWREIPHVTTFGEAEATRLLAVRRDHGLPLEALFVAAVVPPLAAHPEFNATLDGEDLVLKRHYDIGVAVDTPDGLVVVVVRAADQMTLPELADEVSRLTEAATKRQATAADLTGQTFTISNIGAMGGGYGTPIIPFGTTAILSFGRARERPVVRGGRIEVAPMLPLSLSYDHRVIDGALGRRFLSAVAERLETLTFSPPKT